MNADRLHAPDPAGRLSPAPPGDHAPLANVADDFGSLAAAYDSIPHLLFVIGPDDTFVGFRVGGGKTPFVPPSEFMGRRVDEALPSDVTPALLAAIATARRESRLVLHAYALDTPEGRHHYEARLVPTEGGNVTGLVMDVSEDHARASALADSERRLRAIVDNEPECVKVLAPDGYLVEMNRAGLGMLEAGSLEEARARPLIEFVAPEHRAAFADLSRRVFAGETGALKFEVVGLRGTRRWLETSAAPLRDATGSVTALLGITRDITEQRSLEEQYRQAQKLESIGRLAGGIAHDFNNVLTAVVGYADLLRARVGSDPEAQAHVQGVLHAAQRAGELTRQLLAFARRQAVLPRPTQLNTVVEDSQRLLAPLLREDVEIRAELDPEAWPVLVDPSQIQQVILNLAVNARDAMPRGGRLSLSTRNLPAESPEIARLGLRGPHVRLGVRDTGHGIPPDVLPHIFEPFFTTKPPAEGSGLGLATVYGIVSQLGGRLDVRSEPGMGAAIDVYFPRGEHPAESPPVSTDAAPSSRGNETVLLVEDDPLVRDLVAGVLRSAGYRVQVAATPDEAIGMAADPAGRIDLLLTDEVMPGMAGRELARRLRADRPRLPVLRVSGYSESFSGTQDPPGPGIAFLLKPYTPLALRQEVRRLLDEARG